MLGWKEVGWGGPSSCLQQIRRKTGLTSQVHRPSAVDGVVPVKHLQGMTTNGRSLVEESSTDMGSRTRYAEISIERIRWVDTLSAILLISLVEGSYDYYRGRNSATRGNPDGVALHTGMVFPLGIARLHSEYSPNNHHHWGSDAPRSSIEARSRTLHRSNPCIGIGGAYRWDLWRDC